MSKILSMAFCLFLGIGTVCAVPSQSSSFDKVDFLIVGEEEFIIYKDEIVFIEEAVDKPLSEQESRRVILNDGSYFFTEDIKGLGLPEGIKFLAGGGEGGSSGGG